MSLSDICTLAASISTSCSRGLDAEIIGADWEMKDGGCAWFYETRVAKKSGCVKLDSNRSEETTPELT